MREWIVSAEESGMRLLPFLKGRMNDALSARHLKRAIDAGQCQLNGKAERFASTLVGVGDQVRLHMSASRTPLAAPENERSRFLYIDDDLAIYDKPAGIAASDGSMLATVQKKMPQAQLVHRLDRDTTGALIFARAPIISDAMIALFKKRKVRKTYLALVDGILSRPSGVVENYLGKLSEYDGQAIWGPAAKEKGLAACTAWEVEKAGKEASLLVCYPETGRTHQIRVHLSGMGHPILGDYQYGRLFSCGYRPERILLHASSLTFEHPVRKVIVEVVAPLPEDFKKAVEALIGTK
jgi:RluA family pseudouridine synthase